MLYIGIDSGGTKCAFALYDTNLQVLSELVLGTAHPKQVGYEGMGEILNKGISSLCEEFGLVDADSVGIGFGLAGYSPLRQDAKVIQDVVNKVSGKHPYILVNDVEAAHAASLSCNDGICLIGGTGSIAYGKRLNETFRCGGWGYSIGDEGSGYWIGRRALSVCSKEADGRLQESGLLNLVMEEYGLSNPNELIYLVNDTWAAKRDNIARLAPLVISASECDGDAYKILDDACYELSLLANCVNNNLFSKEETVSLSCVGGLFKAGDVILDSLFSKLDDNIEFVQYDANPSLGPVLLLKQKLVKEQ